MSLRAFEPAAWEDGHLYELARGIVVMSEVPGYEHAMVVKSLRDLLRDYERDHPGRIHAVLGTMECKVLVESLATERHPDLAVYRDAPPVSAGKNPWKAWVPDIVVEVVSVGSADGDYVEKREEYLAAGIKEYWILDGIRRQILQLKRTGDRWKEAFLGEDDCLETRLLPGLRLEIASLFV